MTGPNLRNPSGLLRYCGALGLVAASSLVAEVLYRTLETTRLSMIFLAGVVVTAVWLGSGPAFFAAALSFVIYNFYLSEPRFTLQFGNAEDVIILAVFLIVALLTGGLAGRVRDAARRAERRAQTAGALLAASRAFAQATDVGSVLQSLAIHLAEAAKGPALVFDGEKCFLEPTNEPTPDDLLAQIAGLMGREQAQAILQTDQGAWTARHLNSDGASLALAAWRSERGDRPPEDESALIHVLIDMGATAASRARLSAIQAEAESLARTETLRNALLSSVSHDLRTPLASILASASSLREFGDRFDAEVREDLATTIQQEAERLNEFVGNLLNFTRLEGGALHPRLGPIPTPELVERAIARVAPRRGGRRLVARFPTEPPVLLGDPMLLEQALGNILENAVRYSPDGSEICVEVTALDCVRIEVLDQGPGVAAGDIERIFDKFYRSRDMASRVQGTGLGLSITRGFVEAMGGRVLARQRKECTGLAVAIELPHAEIGA